MLYPRTSSEVVKVYNKLYCVGQSFVIDSFSITKLQLEVELYNENKMKKTEI